MSTRPRRLTSARIQPNGRRQFAFLRWSFTRTALPCERGTSPGALTTTLQVTPISDLMWCVTSSALRDAVAGRRVRRQLDLDRHGIERALARQHDLVVRRKPRKADQHRLDLRGIDVDAADDEHVVVAAGHAHDAHMACGRRRRARRVSRVMSRVR